MSDLKKMVAALLCAVSFFVMPLGASADESWKTPKQSAETMVADVFAVRPFQLAALFLGTTAFLLGLPFSLLGDNVEQSYEMMMVEPARLLFQRPLGRF